MGVGEEIFENCGACDEIRGEAQWKHVRRG